MPVVTSVSGYVKPIKLTFAFESNFASNCYWCCRLEFILYPQNYVVLLDSTLSKSQYDYILPQVSFTAIGYHKHITLVFSPTVSTK